MIYFATIIVLFLFSLFQKFDPPESDLKFLKVVSFIILVILGGFRYEVGADWFSYEKLYYSLQGISNVFSAREEKLFTMFSFACRQLVNSYSFFIFCLFFLSFSIKFNVFNKYSPDIFLSLIIYFFTILLIYDLNGVRQGIATSFILLSISPVLNRQLPKFLLFILIASFFHVSAVIFLPFYWLAHIKLSLKQITVISFLMVLLSIPVRSFIEHSKYFEAFFTLKTFSHYSAYLDNNTTGRPVSILSIAVLQRVFTFSLFFINYKKLKAEEGLKNLLINGYLISLIIFFFLSFSSEISSRISFYYKALEIIMIPLIVTSQKKLSNRLALLLIFISFAIIGTIRILSIPNGGLIPYKTVLW